MNDSLPIINANEPGSFSEAEIDDFVALVLAGGEVAAMGLRDRVLKAVQITFLRENKCLLGVAGLKRPSANHRREVARGSNIALDSEALPFELGWVFILPSARNRKLSFPLCQPLVEAALSKGIFATSRSDNGGMHRTLEKLGFVRVGSEWPSKQNNGNLVLFLKHAV
ncbi:MAG: N-acetyltransferase [Blastocatellales bacterium]